MKILILGANGFIGSHLIEAILQKTDWQIDALDVAQHHIEPFLTNPRLHFFQGDMLTETKWLDTHLEKCDVVLPLVAIATPAAYVQTPLKVFELDFEANLPIVRKCALLKKRLIFPSTSEVYGMCPDTEFDEEQSSLVTGPIHKERWIYATSKQLMDRLIYAYGQHEGLSYTLFRPFNWYGPRLDNLKNPKPGGSRVLTQFMGNILRGEPIQLVNGGNQRRCFTYIEDGMDALLRIIENKNGVATNQIFNLGNPTENMTIRSLASLIVKYMQPYCDTAQSTQFIDVDAHAYYGAGYQDVTLRVPAIHKANTHLQWQPKTNFATGLKKTIDYHFGG